MYTNTHTHTSDKAPEGGRNGGRRLRQTDLPRQRHSDHADQLTKTQRGVPSGDLQMLLKEQVSKNRVKLNLQRKTHTEKKKKVHRYKEDCEKIPKCW